MPVPTKAFGEFSSANCCSVVLEGSSETIPSSHIPIASSLRSDRQRVDEYAASLSAVDS